MILYEIDFTLLNCEFPFSDLFYLFILSRAVLFAFKCLAIQFSVRVNSFKGLSGGGSILAVMPPFPSHEYAVRVTITSLALILLTFVKDRHERRSVTWPEHGWRGLHQAQALVVHDRF